MTRAGLKATKRAVRQARAVTPKPAATTVRKAVGRTAAAAAGLPDGCVAGIAMAPSGSRRYLLYEPPGVARTERLPLLVMLHGCNQDARSFAASTRMNRVAARERFLVLYPEQDRLSHPQGCWNWYGTRSGRSRGDASILQAAIAQVCRVHPVDPAAVALVGLSAGASMAALLATRDPAAFAAVVMHSGVPPGSADSTVSAIGAMRGRRRPPALVAGGLPPLLVIHGGADRVVDPGNGRAAAGQWATAMQAGPGPVRVVRRGARHPMKVTDYRADGRLAASLCEVVGLGHAWSGGDARLPFGDARGPDASRLAWTFVARRIAERDRIGAAPVIGGPTGTPSQRAPASATPCGAARRPGRTP